MTRRQRRRSPKRGLVPVPANVPEEKAEVITEPVFERRRPGRPSLLTPEVEGRFVGMLMKGVYRTVAARACGLKPEVVEKWMARGRGKTKDRPALPEYVRFVRLVEQAEAMVEADVTVNIVKRSRHDHNAGLAWLRTRYPERWPRFPGGVEDDDDQPFRAPAPPPMETTPQIAQQTNILMLDAKEWPDLASRLIAQQRQVQERVIEEQQATIEEQEDQAVGVPRHAALDTLRADDSE